MENPTRPPTTSRRWPVFLIGTVLFLAGPVLYFFELERQHLGTPWYLPGLATAGVLCMAVSVAQRRGFWRSAGLALFVLLCGLEWVFLLVLTKTPAYAGPAQPGRKVPEFVGTLADGRPFSNTELVGGRGTAVVFFRGRW